MDRDEALTRRHHFADGHAHTGFKAQVAVRDHAEDRAVGTDDRKTRDVVLTRDRDHVAHEHVGVHGDRFGDDARFVALHLETSAACMSAVMFL